MTSMARWCALVGLLAVKAGPCMHGETDLYARSRRRSERTVCEQQRSGKCCLGPERPTTRSMYARSPQSRCLHSLRTTDYNTREHEAGVSLDGLRDTAQHAARRKPWARGMNSAAMKHYENLIRSTVRDLLGALHKREGEKIDIAAWMTAYG